MEAVTYPTIEHVAMNARPYPTRLLVECDTGLVLFAAAFLGHNDAIHFAEADVMTTCVDIDSERLEEMKLLYPHRWEFVVDDAWKFAEAARELGERWDIVSLDPFTGDAMRRVSESVEVFASLAERFLVVGASKLLPKSEHPQGFRPGRPMVRAASVYWLVFERD